MHSPVTIARLCLDQRHTLHVERTEYHARVWLGSEMSGFMTAFAINMLLPTPRSIWVKILLFIYLFPQLMQVAKSVPRVHPL